MCLYCMPYADLYVSIVAVFLYSFCVLCVCGWCVGVCVFMGLVA